MNRAVVTALTALVLISSGCANIPEQDNPQPIVNSQPAPRPEVPQPSKDADPITIVRSFVQASGSSSTAEAYLTEDARKRWQPGTTPTIIDESFSTVPRTAEPDDDPSTTRVDVVGTEIGRLDENKSFVPSQSIAYKQTVTLRRQLDGQWRIADVPSGLVVPIDVFKNSYRPIKLWFFDPSKLIPVPDLRYVPGSPQATPSDIIALLLAGPTAGLQGAVRTMLPKTATPRTNVTRAADGAMLVNLGDLGEVNAEDKIAIATQVVMSLRDVASTVRLQVEGLPLVPGRQDWKVTDIPPTAADPTPNAQLPGLVVADGRILSLKDGKSIPGPAGAGDYQVESAAQSVDGTQLAVVERTQAGLVLKVGGINEGLRHAAGPAAEMTRPTWQFAVSSDKISNEVWTVADGTVLRLVRTREGTWSQWPVNQAELNGYGKITDVRLSRDGVRVAVVAGGKLYVGAVAKDNQTVAIRAPKALLPDDDTVVSVDWFEQDSLAVATKSTNPVYRVPVDGLEPIRHNSANLTAPLTAITAAPSRHVVVTDAVGMWFTSDTTQVWRTHPVQKGPGARPFYPG